jgi:hypothetical protein
MQKKGMRKMRKKLFVLSSMLFLFLQSCFQSGFLKAYGIPDDANPKNIEFYTGENIGDFEILAGNGLFYFDADTNTIVLPDGALVALADLSPIVPKTGTTFSVAAGAAVGVALYGVDIDVSQNPGKCPISLGNNANLTLSLYNENSFTAGVNRAGIEVPETSTLIFEKNSTGSLIARGNGIGAGIGSSNNENCGRIIIRGGEIHAFGGAAGPGLGVENVDSFAGRIVVNGAQVEAVGGSSCSGIANGSRPRPDGQQVDIRVLSGELKAVGGVNGSGISVSSFSPFVIAGGSLTAIGRGTGSGIGPRTANNVLPAAIFIRGGTVGAIGGPDGGTGIGSLSVPCNITISGANVTAEGGNNAAGIYTVAPGTILVKDGDVSAQGGSNAPGIGATAGNPEKPMIMLVGGKVTARGGPLDDRHRRPGATHANAIGGLVPGSKPILQFSSDPTTARRDSPESSALTREICASHVTIEEGTVQIVPAHKPTHLKFTKSQQLPTLKPHLP